MFFSLTISHPIRPNVNVNLNQNYNVSASAKEVVSVSTCVYAGEKK